MTPSPRIFLQDATSLGSVKDDNTGREAQFLYLPGAVLLVTRQEDPWPLIWWAGRDARYLRRYEREKKRRESYSAEVPISSVLSALCGAERPCAMEEVLAHQSAREAVKMYNQAREAATASPLGLELAESWDALIDAKAASGGRWSWDLHLWCAAALLGAKCTLQEGNHLPPLDMFRSDP